MRRWMTIKTYKGLFIDLDGTVYAGTNPIPTAKKFISELDARGIPYLYVTNNATKSQEDVVAHLKAVSGIDAAPEHVYTSGMAAVDFAKKNYPGARTFVVGEPALQRQVEAAGLLLVEKDIEVVIQGMDRFVTYDKLATASTAIRNGAAFIATNPDVNLPTENGMMPGAGSLTAFLKISTQREPLIIGKPFGYIMDGALERIGLTKEEVVMVGDNYNTDILAGMNYGVDTLLALTGVTTVEDLEEITNKPTHILNDLSEWRFE